MNTGDKPPARATSCEYQAGFTRWARLKRVVDASSDAAAITPDPKDILYYLYLRAIGYEYLHGLDAEIHAEFPGQVGFRSLGSKSLGQ